MVVGAGNGLADYNVIARPLDKIRHPTACDKKCDKTDTLPSLHLTLGRFGTLSQRECDFHGIFVLESASKIA